MAQPTPDTQTELERREAALAAREAELARQQAELQAQTQRRQREGAVPGKFTEWLLDLPPPRAILNTV